MNCKACGQAIVRDWTPSDPTLREYHAGCRPGSGRIPYRQPAPIERSDPFDLSGDEEPACEPA